MLGVAAGDGSCPVPILGMLFDNLLNVYIEVHCSEKEAKDEGLLDSCS